MKNKIIYILTGPVHSGKTTALFNLASRNKNMAGILTPIVNNERVFYDIGSASYFTMLAKKDETKFIIGKYLFSEAAFEKAAALLYAASLKTNWIIIDEIGPLELKDQGFSGVLQQLTRNTNPANLVLVIRDSCLEEVINKFQLANIISTQFTASTLPALLQH